MGSLGSSSSSLLVCDMRGAHISASPPVSVQGRTWCGLALGCCVATGRAWVDTELGGWVAGLGVISSVTVH